RGGHQDGRRRRRQSRGRPAGAGAGEGEDAEAGYRPGVGRLSALPGPAPQASRWRLAAGCVARRRRRSPPVPAGTAAKTPVPAGTAAKTTVPAGGVAKPMAPPASHRRVSAGNATKARAAHETAADGARFPGSVCCWAPGPPEASAGRCVLWSRFLLVLLLVLVLPGASRFSSVPFSGARRPGTRPRASRFQERRSRTAYSEKA